MKARLKLSANPPRDGEVEHAAELFRQQGALWLENVIAAETVDQLRRDFFEKYLTMSKQEGGSENQVPDLTQGIGVAVGDRRFMATVDIKGRFNDAAVYANANLMPILNAILSNEIRIASFGAVVSLPGATDQPIHLDHPPLFPGFENAGKDAPVLPAYAVTVVIPLVNIDDTIGTTAIWEGSHCRPDRFRLLQNLLETQDYTGASYPLPKCGDVYLMDYRIIHGGLANRSSLPRPILYSVYSRRWFRDGANFSNQKPVSISKKQKKKVPKRLRPLFD